MASPSGRIRTYHFRIVSQILFSFVAILGIFGIGMSGFIYPFFFCPASPGACAGCPIWVIEHGTIEIAAGMATGYMMILYLIGMFLAIGMIVGRSFCGWACPVGTLQDLFSFFNRKISSIRSLIILSSISFFMLLIGILVPMYIKENGIPILVAEGDVELVHYMWLGYIGAMGSFMAALSGVIFLRRSKSLIPSFALIGIGTFFWILNLISISAGFDNSPTSSIELMGLFGLMFQVIGLVGIIRSAFKDREMKIEPMKGIDRWGRLTKVALLILIAPSSWFFETLFFTDFDPIGGITATIPELLLNPTGWTGNDFFWIKAVFVVSVICFVAFVDRAWCRYLCPIGAMYGPTNKISLTDIEFKEEACIHCQKCIKVCPMGINPKENKTDPECIRCGRCAEVCPVNAQLWTPVNSTIKGVFKR